MWIKRKERVFVEARVSEWKSEEHTMKVCAQQLQVVHLTCVPTL